MRSLPRPGHPGGLNLASLTPSRRAMLHRDGARNVGGYTGSMYGYQPPQQDPDGSWSEIFVMSRVVLGLLAIPMLVIFGVLFLLGSAVWLLSIHPFLSLAPLAILGVRSEEHTSELQSLMRISYAVFCL